MQDYTSLSDRDILRELVRHRAIAEHCANELMRRANDDTSDETR